MILTGFLSVPISDFFFTVTVICRTTLFFGQAGKTVGYFSIRNYLFCSYAEVLMVGPELELSFVAVFRFSDCKK